MLKVIYTIFLGLILATFIGIGIATFYPAPKAPDYPTSLMKPAPVASPGQTLAPAEKQQQDQQTKAQTDFEAAQKDYQQKSELYGRNVSIIATIAAVLILIISLTFMRGILLIADGLLLGGVFTLLYGIGWGLAQSGDNRYRFLVVSVGLLVALILGYVRFVNPDKPKTTSHQ